MISLNKLISCKNILAIITGTSGHLGRLISSTLAPYININAISPGGIYRNQSKKFVGNYSKKVPLKRMANEKDFIGPFAFLSSDMSNYITGQNLKVDGGYGLS